MDGSEGIANFVNAERLGEERVETEAEGGGPLIGEDIGSKREEGDGFGERGGLKILAADEASEIEAVHPGHFNIDDEEVERGLGHQFLGFDPVDRGIGLITESFEGSQQHKTIL